MLPHQIGSLWANVSSDRPVMLVYEADRKAGRKATADVPRGDGGTTRRGRL
jgi:hypothetical protein